jgi:transposase-like protein
MRSQRSFSLEFKCQVVEELMSGESRPAQLCRRYNITSSVLYHWKKQYCRGKFNNEPTEEGALRDRMMNRRKPDWLLTKSAFSGMTFWLIRRELQMAPKGNAFGDVFKHG